jgi:hypothetical protein
MPQHRTRSMASITDFEFIMGTILNQKVGTPLFLAFDQAGITDVEGITSLDDRAINRLKYRDNSFQPVTNEELGVGYQQLIRAFNAFVETKNDDADPIHNDWQNKASRDEFNQYRLVGFAKYVGVRQAPAPTVVTSGSHHATNKPRDRVFEFQRESSVTQHLLPS